MPPVVRPALTLALVALALFTVGCQAPYRIHRVGERKVVVMDLEALFPLNEVTNDFSFDIHTSGGVGGGSGDGEGGARESAEAAGSLKQTLHALYTQLDNLNAQIRSFLIIQYSIYVNAELDPDLSAEQRDVERTYWSSTVSTLQTMSFRLRAVTDLAVSASASSDPSAFKDALDQAIGQLDRVQERLDALSTDRVNAVRERAESTGAGTQRRLPGESAGDEAELPPAQGPQQPAGDGP